MRLERFYLLCLVFPLVVALSTALVTRFAMGPLLLYGIAVFIFSLSLFAGPPYFIFAALVLFAARNVPVADYFRLSLCLPFGLAGVVFMSIVVYAAFSPWLEVQRAARASGRTVLTAVAAGYLYVGLIHALRVFLSRRGLLARAA
jgi:hypothetical protein